MATRGGVGRRMDEISDGADGMVTNVDYMLGHKTNFKTFLKIKIIQGIFSTIM